MMKNMTKKIGKFLYRDGPAVIATILFAGIFVQNYTNMTS